MVDRLTQAVCNCGRIVGRNRRLLEVRGISRDDEIESGRVRTGYLHVVLKVIALQSLRLGQPRLPGKQQVKHYISIYENV